MRCPYLSSASKKECVKMIEENMDAEVSDFDFEHFCDGNPVFCYYFRLPSLQDKHFSKPVHFLEELSDGLPLSKDLIKDISVKRDKCALE